MDDAQRFTAAEAADPSTPGEVLAAIAGSRPDLRPYVAANPSAYPGLLEWLGQLGDPAVDGALRARGHADEAVRAGEDERSGPGSSWQTDASDRTMVQPAPGGGQDIPVGGESATHETVAFATGSVEPAPGDAGGRHAADGPHGAGAADTTAAPAAGGAAASDEPGLGAGPVDESGRGAGAYVPPAGAYAPPATGAPGGGYVPPGGTAPAVGYGTGAPYPAGQGHQDQGAPGPYAPYGTPGGPPPKKSRTWLWVLLGLLALFVVGGIVVAVFVWQGIQDVAEDGGGMFGTGEAHSYGDDAALDSLWDSCEAGDMAACDELYRESPVDSEYEEFGDSCGGRTEGGVWCEDLDEGTASGEPGNRADPALAWA